MLIGKLRGDYPRTIYLQASSGTQNSKNRSFLLIVTDIKVFAAYLFNLCGIY